MNMASNNFIKKFLIAVSFAFLFSCSYSFTGSSVPPHIKTVYISVFQDRTNSGEFNLGDRVTKQLIQKFLDDNTLMVSSLTNANATINGTIISLNDAPSAISGKEQVASRRITLTIQVVYKDVVKKQTIFDKSFSDFTDYIATGDISNTRKKAIEDTINKITENILLGVVSNW
ncbi:MAG: LPS assembly lipoprotein LptE [Melioribacteraceae bacterium]|nr:LPS assembly lipoprotein LptE [Melioribacteraceae bacterium]